MFTRVATALISAAGLFALLYFRGIALLLSIMVFMLIGIFEVQSALIQGGYKPLRLPSILFALSSCALWFLGYLPYLPYLLIVFFLIVCISELFRKQPSFSGLLYTFTPLIYPTIPLLLLMDLITLNPDIMGQFAILFTCSIALFSDIFGYLIGSPFGKHKLSPIISPNKSVEGAVAGVAGSCICSTGMYLLATNFGVSLPLWHVIILALVGSVLSICGDLTASLIKRQCNVKDFGWVFPGHGGVIDRLDSVFFTALLLHMYFKIFYIA